MHTLTMKKESKIMLMERQIRLEIRWTLLVNIAKILKRCTLFLTYLAFITILNRELTPISIRKHDSLVEYLVTSTSFSIPILPVNAHLDICFTNSFGIPAGKKIIFIH